MSLKWKIPSLAEMQDKFPDIDPAGAGVTQENQGQIVDIKINRKYFLKVPKSIKSKSDVPHKRAQFSKQRTLSVTFDETNLQSNEKIKTQMSKNRQFAHWNNQDAIFMVRSKNSKHTIDPIQAMINSAITKRKGSCSVAVNDLKNNVKLVTIRSPTSSMNTKSEVGQKNMTGKLANQATRVVSKKPVKIMYTKKSKTTRFPVIVKNGNPVGVKNLANSKLRTRVNAVQEEDEEGNSEGEIQASTPVVTSEIRPLCSQV